MRPNPQPHFFRTRRSWKWLVFIFLLNAFSPPQDAWAGGAGTNLPPFPLPVRATEFRIAGQIPMVCVDDSEIRCVAPYLDAPSDATNTDGGTFRSTVCPGVSPGACRPEYIDGAVVTGEFLVDWPITRTPPDPDPGIDPGLVCGGGSYKFCYEGNLRLNVTAPGVSVSNPVVELDYPGVCNCVFDVADEQTYAGESIEDYWVTRNQGATCDLALEFATLLPRDQIRSIGQQAFPNLLCQPDGMGACTREVEPILIEPDGSLTKGCGDAPTNTFAIRFVEANEPLAFEKRPLPGIPVALADVDGDGDVDFQTADRTVVQLNDGANVFSSLPTGLSPGAVGDLGDWTGDGDPDLVSSTGGVVRVYPGDGAGGFDEFASFVIDTAPGSPKLRDLNGDLRPDAVSTTGGSTRVIWNTTGGPISPALDVVGFGTTTVADVDGGGLPDLIGLGSGQWAENIAPGSLLVQGLAAVPMNPEDVASLIGPEVADAIGCSLPASTCCVPNEEFEPGCSDATCESAVCAIDSNCCGSAWDSTCSATAATLPACTTCFDPVASDCCAGSSCSDASCEAVVCALDSGCCGGNWDSNCAATAQGWCGVCQNYVVSCSVFANDVAVADVEGDGDNDLVVLITIDQSLQAANTGEQASMSYLTWLPNRQVDDPVASGGDPLFDPIAEPWRPIGPSLSDTGESSGGQIELVDLDDDSDPDLVGIAYWYRNDAGSYAGPFALAGAAPDLGTSVTEANKALFVEDMDGDGSRDVVTFDSVYVPEAALPTLLVPCAATLALLGAQRRRRSIRGAPRYRGSD